MLKFLRNEQGATVIEYAFICAVIVLVMLAGLLVLSDGSTGQMNYISDEVTGAMTKSN